MVFESTAIAALLLLLSCCQSRYGTLWGRSMHFRIAITLASSQYNNNGFCRKDKLTNKTNTDYCMGKLQNYLMWR